MAGTGYDRLSDRELVEYCNGGSRDEATQAFATLYRRHRDYVTRVSLRFSSDREIAADVQQETFIYLLQKFPPAGKGLELSAQLRSLLYPVARNLTISAIRRRRRDDPGTVVEPDRLPDPRSVNPQHENLARMVANLSPRHREVILLRFVDDLRLDEIGKALDIPVGTVKSRLHNAIRQLRKALNIKQIDFL